MKSVLAAAIGLAITALANPAAAYVAAVATSIPIADVQDRTQLATAVQSAIADVLDHAVAFTPTAVSLHDAQIVGDRMYLLVLVADKEGEAALKALAGESPWSADEPDTSEGAGDEADGERTDL